MTAIAIGERVDGHKPMMQAHRDLVGGKGLMLNPIGKVIEHHRHFRRDRHRVNANVALGAPRVAGTIQFAGMTVLTALISSLSVTVLWALYFLTEVVNRPAMDVE